MSFSVIVEQAKLVTPNRVEIIEIDLKNVNDWEGISGFKGEFNGK